MKKSRIALALYGVCLSMVAAFTACSSIDENERLIYVEPLVPVDTTTVIAETDSLYDAPIAVVSRRVLIEDHTGQRCPNCPDAAVLVHEYQQTFGDLIVPVAIHSEMQGIMEPEGLGNELGNTYYKNWNLEYKPAGLLNRVDFGGMRVLDKTTWTVALQYLMQPEYLETPLDIRIRARQAEDNPQEANVDVKVLCTKPEATVNGKLQVWVTEDNIIARQDSMGTRVDNYVHNHVLRASLNGAWGEDISLSGAEGNNVRELHYTAALSPAWKPQDLVIVAFVYDGDGNGEVRQVTKAKLKVNESSK